MKNYIFLNFNYIKKINKNSIIFMFYYNFREKYKGCEKLIYMDYT